MRRLLLAFGLVLIPQFSWAQCAGTDLLAAMEQSDPATHARITEKASAVPNGEGKFWRVERAGAQPLAGPSWLFGTFHDTAAGAEALDPAVEAAMTGARLMFVELTDTEQQKHADPHGHRSGVHHCPRRQWHFRATDRGGAHGRCRASGKPGLEPANRRAIEAWMLFTSLALPACMLARHRQGS